MGRRMIDRLISLRMIEVMLSNDQLKYVHYIYVSIALIIHRSLFSLLTYAYIYYCYYYCTIRWSMHRGYIPPYFSGARGD